ncbi:MAG: hypothetical protein U0521_28425 [Anaerolineae bacterium]
MGRLRLHHRRRRRLVRRGRCSKYVVNGGFATWMLVNMVEFNPAAFGDGAMNIPESGDGVRTSLTKRAGRWIS